MHTAHVDRQDARFDRGQFAAPNTMHSERSGAYRPQM